MYGTDRMSLHSIYQRAASNQTTRRELALVLAVSRARSRFADTSPCSLHAGVGLCRRSGSWMAKGGTVSALQAPPGASAEDAGTSGRFASRRAGR